jgi:hypothetical protein
MVRPQSCHSYGTELLDEEKQPSTSEHDNVVLVSNGTEAKAAQA